MISWLTECEAKKNREVRGEMGIQSGPLKLCTRRKRGKMEIEEDGNIEITGQLAVEYSLVRAEVCSMYCVSQLHTRTDVGNGINKGEIARSHLVQMCITHPRAR